MHFDEKMKIFDEFYSWLKKDGLKPKRSERLHRKKILEGLIYNDEMTIENFNDFLEDRKALQIKNLVGQVIVIQKEEHLINDIQIKNENNFKIITNKIIISCKYSNFERILSQLKE